MNLKVVYPHSFLHKFGKNYLEKYYDTSLLVNLKGHESVKTSRIYLRKTSTEKQLIVEKVVTWYPDLFIISYLCNIIPHIFMEKDSGYAYILTTPSFKEDKVKIDTSLS